MNGKQTLRHSMMFPGIDDFKEVVGKKASGASASRLDSFFRCLEDGLERASKSYCDEIVERNTVSGVPPHRIAADIAGLRSALKKTRYQPFSQVVSPYVDISDGVPTRLGERLLMSREVAAMINSPSSEIVRLMSSLSDLGITFESMSASSYEAFNYARAGIAVAGQKSAGAIEAPKPLLWLPLGNSLFIASAHNYLEAHGDASMTVVNVGAGPGALEQMVGKHLSAFSRRVKVVSVEVDGANLKSLGSLSSKLPNIAIVEGDFVKSETRARVMQEIIPGSACFVIAGYSLHHTSPDSTAGTIAWMKAMAGNRGLIQIHDVFAGESGGGQSPVNRLFFNFMTPYHLLFFHPDSYFTGRGFSVMEARDAGRIVNFHPEFFDSATPPEKAERMVENGSVMVFRDRPG